MSCLVKREDSIFTFAFFATFELLDLQALTHASGANAVFTYLLPGRAYDVPFITSVF